MSRRGEPEYAGGGGPMVRHAPAVARRTQGPGRFLFDKQAIERSFGCVWSDKDSARRQPLLAKMDSGASEQSPHSGNPFDAVEDRSDVMMRERSVTTSVETQYSRRVPMTRSESQFTESGLHSGSSRTRRYRSLSCSEESEEKDASMYGFPLLDLPRRAWYKVLDYLPFHDVVTNIVPLRKDLLSMYEFLPCTDNSCHFESSSSPGFSPSYSSRSLSSKLGSDSWLGASRTNTDRPVYNKERKEPQCPACRRVFAGMRSESNELTGCYLCSRTAQMPPVYWHYRKHLSFADTSRPLPGLSRSPSRRKRCVSDMKVNHPENDEGDSRSLLQAPFTGFRTYTEFFRCFPNLRSLDFSSVRLPMVSIARMVETSQVPQGIPLVSPRIFKAAEGNRLEGRTLSQTSSLFEESVCSSRHSTLVASQDESCESQESIPTQVAVCMRCGVTEYVCVAASGVLVCAACHPLLAACVSSRPLYPANSAPESRISALVLSRCGREVTDALVDLVAALTPHLRELDLDWCSAVTDHGLAAVVRRHGSQLRRLSLNFMPSMEGNALMGMATNCPNLQYLDLSWNTHFMPGFLEECLRLLANHVGFVPMPNERIRSRPRHVRQRSASSVPAIGRSSRRRMAEDTRTLMLTDSVGTPEHKSLEVDSMRVRRVGSPDSVRSLRSRGDDALDGEGRSMSSIGMRRHSSRMSFASVLGIRGIYSERSNHESKQAGRVEDEHSDRATSNLRPNSTRESSSHRADSATGGGPLLARMQRNRTGFDPRRRLVRRVRRVHSVTGPDPSLRVSVRPERARDDDEELSLSLTSLNSQSVAMGDLDDSDLSSIASDASSVVSVLGKRSRRGSVAAGAEGEMALPIAVLDHDGSANTPLMRPASCRGGLFPHGLLEDSDGDQSSSSLLRDDSMQPGVKRVMSDMPGVMRSPPRRITALHERVGTPSRDAPRSPVCHSAYRLSRRPRLLQVRAPPSEERGLRVLLLNGWGSVSSAPHLGVRKGGAGGCWSKGLARRIGALRSLRRLSLVRCESITDEFLGIAVRSLSSLKNLDAAGCTQLTDVACVQLVKSCPQLESLNLSSCHRITDDGVVKLASLQRLVRLRLREVWNLTWKVFVPLSNALSNTEGGNFASLKCLDLAWCVNISPSLCREAMQLRESLKITTGTFGVFDANAPQCLPSDVRFSQRDRDASPTDLRQRIGDARARIKQMVVSADNPCTRDEDRGFVEN